jgi:hypothetical protein
MGELFIARPWNISQTQWGESILGKARFLHMLLIAIFNVQIQNGKKVAMLSHGAQGLRVVRGTHLASDKNGAPQPCAHKLVRINGHLYSVRRKAGKRTLVRQATDNKTAVSSGVGLKCLGLSSTLQGDCCVLLCTFH